MNGRKWMLTAAALLLMAAGSGVLLRLKVKQRLGEPGIRVSRVQPGGRLRIELPERVLDFSSTNLEPMAVEVATLPKDTTFAKRLYRAPDGFQAFASVVLMGTDRTSIHKPEYCLTAQGWRIVQRETVSLPVERPHAYPLPARRFTARLAARSPTGQLEHYSGVYVFWFVAGNRITASHLDRMGWITYELLRSGTLPRWAYIAFFAACRPGQEEAAYERMKPLIAAAVPEFQTTTLPPTPPAPASR